MAGPEILTVDPIDQSQLPESYKPQGPVTETNVEAEGANGMKLTVDDLREIEETFGVACVSAKQIRSLNNLAIYLKPFNIRTLTQSNMFLAQQHLMPLLKKLAEAATNGNTKEANKLAHTVGYLAEKLAKVGQVTKSVGEVQAEQSKPKNQSFAAGEMVVPSVHIHMNQATQVNKQ